MRSTIVTGGDVTTRSNYLHNISGKKSELIHIFSEKTTITIKQIKDLSTPLSIAPRLPRIIWIEEANLLTIPAQNALLKMLEEPPEGTTFYLTCVSATTLLPTIRSRCVTISQDEIYAQTSSTVLSDLKAVMTLSPGDRLTSLIKRDRIESLAWIGEIESELSKHLRASRLTSKSATTLAQIARLAQNLHLQLASNASVSLATQNFYLLLPHTRSVA